MKKIFSVSLALLMLVLTGCHKDILNEINDLKNRVTTLEEKCVTMNTNIDALQVLVNAQSSGDMISNVSEITYGESTVGYTITFTSGKTITLYNGKDGADGKDGENGKDGSNGTNGTDGYSPSIGVAQDTDGVYYWTLDGAWLLDANGNKLPVTGAKGEKGDQGDKGDTGTTGASGTNGITPQLKIEEDGYWYVSYNNGTTWEKLGKATGEDGKDGANGTNGEKGDKGDSMFSSVTQDDNYVYFTLADGTTVITVSKYVENDYYTITYNANGGTGTMEAEQYSTMKAATVKACTFTYNAGHRFIGWNTQANGMGVSFAVGDIILQPQDLTLYAQWNEIRFSISATQKVIFAPGNLQYQASTNTWRFADNQYDYIGDANSNISSSYTGWIDLFGWGTGNNPTNTSTSYSDYSTFTDWGKNAIGIYPADFWRTLTKDEWVYVFQTRTNASSLYGFATVNGTIGLILLPDSWTLPSGLTFNAGTAAFTNNVYSTKQWSQMESAGAVFLPAAGRRDGTSVDYVQSGGYYWSSTVIGTYRAYYLYFYDSRLRPQDDYDRYYGLSVRLVQDL